MTTPPRVQSASRAAPPACLAAALLLAAPAAAQEGFHVELLAPGVWSAEVVARPPFYAFANSLIVELDEGVLVVDTQQSPSAARDLIAAIRSLTPTPVRWVVNTHWHGDHVYGNAAYREAFPGVAFLAHESTARDVATRAAERMREEAERLPGVVAQREAWLAAGAGPDGTPLDADGRARVTYSLDVNRRQIEELRGLDLVVPEGFADSLDLGRGRRRVRLLHVGPAHTDGDVVVWLPGERIVAVGDLVEAGLPWAAEADPGGWALALARVEALGAAVVVPSHGAVDRGGELLAVQAGMFAALREQVAGLRGRGVGWDAVPDRLELDRFRDALVPGPAGREAWRTFLAEAVEAMRRVEGRPPSGGGPAATS